MKHLTSRPWDSSIKSEITMGLMIIVLIEPTVLGQGSRLRVSYAVLALKEAAIREMQGSVFYNTNVPISLQGNPIGLLSVASMITPPAAIGQANSTESVDGTSSFTANSGTIIDLLYSDYKFVWEYSETRINSKELFLAALDAFAISPQQPGQARCRSLEAISPLSFTGQAIITISEELVAGNLSPLSYSDAIIAIYLIWRELNVGKNTFGELKFEIFYRGVKRGTGMIDKLPPPFPVASS